ncbi:hypothetical protein ONR57_22820 [Hoyosella sp. YIM 151337]|uniref:hypothetical protein n=1 Tax=Hoyosella sp. YIM 151337 TaxID=2992742 RepID=UPI002236C016|nr:hypothetical protein [Hoyosella sp. YIM 151337]MCW4356143.1 hypothetical protein [Hoyosella sp. YIM 151337]
MPTALDDVAAALTSAGTAVTASELEAAAAGGQELSAEILAALARHFRAQPEYLTSSDSAVYGPIHAEATLIRRMKDGGVTQLYLRGAPTSATRRLLSQLLGKHQR